MDAVDTDLSALGGMSALLRLDASHNALTQLLTFTPPNCLKVVKMSHNQITEMTDLSAHQHLNHLDLDRKNVYCFVSAFINTLFSLDV